MGMSGLDLSDASLEVGKQVTGLQVADVKTSNLGQSHTAVSANKRGDSRNRGEGGKVHVVKDSCLYYGITRDSLCGGFKEAKDRCEPIRTSQRNDLEG